METPHEQGQEAIAARAYELYLERQRDGTPGDDLSDWCRAEEELAGREEETPLAQKRSDRTERTPRRAIS